MFEIFKVENYTNTLSSLTIHDFIRKNSDESYAPKDIKTKVCKKCRPLGDGKCNRVIEASIPPVVWRI